MIGQELDHELVEARGYKQVSRINVQPVEMDSELCAFHEDVARALWCENWTQYIEHVLQFYARYLLRDNQAELGRIMAEDAIAGHCINECQLTGD